jgi:competence protein ComEA
MPAGTKGGGFSFERSSGRRERVMCAGGFLKKLWASLIIILLVTGVYWGYRIWCDGEGASAEWQTVNREMESLLGSGTPVLSPPPKAVPPSPAAQQPERVPGETSAAASDAKLIDINTAAVSRLKDLPGIGDSKAKAVIAYREANGPFKSAEDLMKVKGIGPKIFESLKERITVSP